MTKKKYSLQGHITFSRHWKTALYRVCFPQNNMQCLSLILSFPPKFQLTLLILRANRDNVLLAYYWIYNIRSKSDPVSVFCTKRLFTTHKIAYFEEQFKNKSSIPLLLHSNLETDQAEVWKQERKWVGSDFRLVLKVDAYPPQAVSQTCWALGIEHHQPLCSPLESVGTIKSEVQWRKALALWNQNYLSETLRVTS